MLTFKNHKNWLCYDIRAVMWPTSPKNEKQENSPSKCKSWLKKKCSIILQFDNNLLSDSSRIVSAKQPLVQLPGGSRNLFFLKYLSGTVIKTYIFHKEHLLFWLTHFSSLFLFIFTWNYQKTSGFLMFSGWIKREYWFKIGNTQKEMLLEKDSRLDKTPW